MEFLINPDGTRGQKFEKGIDQSWMTNSKTSSQFNELPIFMSSYSITHCILHKVRFSSTCNKISPRKCLEPQDEWRECRCWDRQLCASDALTGWAHMSCCLCSPQRAFKRINIIKMSWVSQLSILQLTQFRIRKLYSQQWKTITREKHLRLYSAYIPYLFTLDDSILG